MKLTIENKHKVLGRIVKHDIIMLLPELNHKGETYMFKAVDDNKNHYRWELTRHRMVSGRYQLLFSDGRRNEKTYVETYAIDSVDNFLYICSSMMPY
jgi:hypothetical protein